MPVAARITLSGFQTVETTLMWNVTLVVDWLLELGFRDVCKPLSHFKHEKQNNKLPVYLVNLKQRDRPFMRRAPKFDIMINRMVREMHRLNGYEVRPPYCVDHGAGVMCYSNPRGMKWAAPARQRR